MPTEIGSCEAKNLLAEKLQVLQRLERGLQWSLERLPALITPVRQAVNPITEAIHRFTQLCAQRGLLPRQ